MRRFVLAAEFGVTFLMIEQMHEASVISDETQAAIDPARVATGAGATADHSSRTNPNRKRGRRITKNLREDLIEAIALAGLPPTALAHAFDLSLHALAAWVSDAENAQAIEQLARLAELRAKMLLAQLRATAAARLAHIAAGEPSELARKACVDLLKSEVALPFHIDRDADAPAPPSAEAILALLESLGADRDNALSLAHHECPSDDASSPPPSSSFASSSSSPAQPPSS